MKLKLIFDTTSAQTIADSDSVGAFVRAADGTVISATGTALDVNIDNASIVVTATDLDIRDLAFATDKVDVSGSSVDVSATDLDIRDLSAAQDSIESHVHDGSGNAISSTSGALDVYVTGSGPLTVNDAALANTAIVATSNTLAVADTPEDLVASPLANRKYLFVYNNDSRLAYIGQSGVGASSGFPLAPGAMLQLRAGPAVDIEWVSSKVSHDMRTLELS